MMNEASVLGDNCAAGFLVAALSWSKCAISGAKGGWRAGGAARGSPGFVRMADDLIDRGP